MARRRPRPIRSRAAASGVASREVVVSTAIRLIERDGFHGLSVAAIAAELGVRAPSLYKHIETREGLAREVARECTRQLLAALQTSVLAQSGRQALLGLTGAFRRFAKERPGAYAATVTTPAPEDSEHMAARDGMIALVGTVLR